MTILQLRHWMQAANGDIHNRIELEHDRLYKWKTLHEEQCMPVMFGSPMARVHLHVSCFVVLVLQPSGLAL